MTDEERKDLDADRRAYLLGHVLVFTIGVGAVLSALASLILLAAHEPLADTSSLATLFPTWAEVLWALAYLAGGLLLTRGIWALSLRSEVAGCSLVAGTQLVNVYAITVIRGPAAGFISGVGFAVAVGLIARIVILLHLRRRLG